MPVNCIVTIGRPDGRVDVGLRARELEVLARHLRVGALGVVRVAAVLEEVVVGHPGHRLRSRTPGAGDGDRRVAGDDDRRGSARSAPRSRREAGRRLAAAATTLVVVVAFLPLLAFVVHGDASCARQRLQRARRAGRACSAVERRVGPAISALRARVEEVVGRGRPLLPGLDEARAGRRGSCRRPAFCEASIEGPSSDGVRS